VRNRQSSEPLAKLPRAINPVEARLHRLRKTSLGTLTSVRARLQSCRNRNETTRWASAPAARFSSSRLGNRLTFAICEVVPRHEQQPQSDFVRRSAERLILPIQRHFAEQRDGAINRCSRLSTGRRTGRSLPEALTQAEVRRGRKVRTPQGSVPDNVRDAGFKARGRPVPQKTNRLGYPSSFLRNRLRATLKQLAASAPG